MSSPNNFVRKALPKEFFCSVCLQILADPVYCPNCRVMACAKCLPKTIETAKCSHEGRFNETSIKAKITDLHVRCKNWTHGCMKLSKLADLKKHEDACVFEKSQCHKPGCAHANHEKRLDAHVLLCPLEHIKGELEGFEPGKLIETPCHSCSQWLKDVSENFEIRTSIFKDENEEIRHEIGTQKVQFEADKVSLRSRISETEAKNQEYEKSLKELRTQYELQIKKLEEESAYKMKVFHEQADQRIANYLKNTQENFKQFSGQLTDAVKVYLEGVKSKADSYNESVEKRADGFIDRRVLESVKGNAGRAAKGGNHNNSTMISGGSNNTTMITNANNSLLK